MSHGNAALTPRARLRLAMLIVAEGWPPSAAAKMFMVSPVTARKWAARLRAEGPTGMSDRSSRPRSMPNSTAPEVVRLIVRLRWRRRLGPAQIAGELGLPASTVHAVLVRCRINRLSRIDRVTGEPIRACQVVCVSGRGGVGRGRGGFGRGRRGRVVRGLVSSSWSRLLR